jgi:hypothetical protein
VTAFLNDVDGHAASSLHDFDEVAYSLVSSKIRRNNDRNDDHMYRPIPYPYILPIGSEGPNRPLLLSLLLLLLLLLVLLL